MFDSDQRDIESEVQKSIVFAELIPGNHLKRKAGLVEGFLEATEEDSLLHRGVGRRGENDSNGDPSLLTFFNERVHVNRRAGGIIDFQGRVENKL